MCDCQSPFQLETLMKQNILKSSKRPMNEHQSKKQRQVSADNFDLL
jgi:hypothetical protein